MYWLANIYKSTDFLEHISYDIMEKFTRDPDWNGYHIGYTPELTEGARKRADRLHYVPHTYYVPLDGTKEYCLLEAGENGRLKTEPLIWKETLTPISIDRQTKEVPEAVVSLIKEHLDGDDFFLWYDGTGRIFATGPKLGDSDWRKCSLP